MQLRPCSRSLGALVVVGVASVAFGACSGNDGATSSPSSTTRASSVSTTSTAASTGAATPEAAIGAYLADRGNEYIGDCSGSDPATDLGKYCSILQEDRGDSQSYLVGPVASEGETIVVTRTGQGWELSVPAP